MDGQLAVQVIKDWKSDDGTLRKQYGSLGEYTIHCQVEAGWKDPEIRAEFGNDRGTYEHWLRNEHNVTFHGRGNCIR